ncbi:protein ESSENTIAL FOR POTEXVIRUS ACCUMULATION 1 isoform X2 [Cicer arietinum]|uniref:Uncharacterized protein LOC101507508 n=1 Tax=Cicer arietinum TaxID=3827 RepID=A0A1S2Y5J4_CICAR|nr:uncharacterized protein LOC101507508 [Cicer arietinum]
MAQNSTSDTRHHANSAPPLQISKDVQGSDVSIPLSPQWLLPKPGESKSGTGNVENRVISNPSHGSRPETMKTYGDGEDGLDAQKRKDVFRPSMFDSESGRRDRWRDEERDTKSSIRKDRWRDGDKDLGDSRKVDRWGENSAPKNLGEARRVTSDNHRWNDSGNREANFDQRRESKWNSRWGPNDKEPEGREKWSDSGKDGDIHQDKGLSHGKDEKEGDHVRPWRPNFSQSRGRVEGRVEPPHSQSTPPNKQVSTFSYGRGRGDNTPPLFSLGQGRGGSGGSPLNSPYSGVALENVESGHEEPCPFRYNRTKLLDVYRVTNMGTNKKLVDDFVQVPNLTQDEPLEPLALTTPNSEELSVLNGIDKGEIISSSAPQVTKEGKGSTDFTHTRRMKPGITPLQDRGEDGGSYKVSDELSSNRDSSFEGNSSLHPGSAWRATPAGEHTSTFLHNSRDVPSDVRQRKSDASTHQPKDPHSQWESSLGFVSDSKEVGKWQASEDPVVKRQLSGILESELGARRVPPTAPEELSLLYKDPKGQIQGPFKGIDIIGWFEAGYFGIDLPVRLENSAVDSPWFSLGDVMPHLRAKARPPPGFPAPKPNDLAEITNRQNPGTFGNTLTGLSEAEMLKSDSRHRQGSDTGVENRFLESLMSGNKSSSTLNNLAVSEGFQGFAGNNSGNLGPSGVDSGNMYLLAKRLALERQMSLPNSYPYWPGQDAASLAPKSDVPDVSLHSSLLSSASDNSRQPQSQNSELLSIIQGLSSDRTSAGINNGTAGWPNNPVQGGLDLLHNKIDSLHDQNFPQMPFGIQQQRLTPQNQLSLSNLLSQATDNPAGALTAEKILSSGIPQDPQIMNLLQQQYLLQLHSQAAASAPQLPLLDKLLLLKQQQKQEEQQLFLRQQQQQLLSKMLQDQQSSQLFGNSSYGQLQSALPMGNLRVDPSQLQPPQEIFPMSSQIPIPSVHNEINTSSMNLHLQVTQDTSNTVTSKASTMRLPHQLFGDTTPQNNWAPTLAEQINDKYQKQTPASHVESSLLHDLNRSKEEPHIVKEPVSVSDYTAKSLEQVPGSTFKPDVVIPATSMPSENSIHLQGDAPAVDISSAVSSGIELPPASHLGSDMKFKSNIAHQEQLAVIDSSNAEPSVGDDERNVEAREPKKAAEKKSKKQKSNKPQSADQAKGLLKNKTLQPSKQSEVEIPNFNELGETNNNGLNETYVSAPAASVSRNMTETFVAGESKTVGSVSTQNTEAPAGRAWKPAPSVKPKSLLEIQQEEQRKAETEMLVSDVAASVNSMSLGTPWAGVVTNPDSVKVFSESHREDNTGFSVKSQSSQNLKSMKSPLHDLLAEEVLKKFNETDAEVPDSTLSLHDIAVHSEPVDDGTFIEAKESKRSRKKSGKSKGSGVKAPVPALSAEVPISSSPIEKGKSSRSAQQEKEVLPSIPAGPSLGDFVLWKGEREQPIPSPSPAWSTDSGRVPKPTSLRDILKEQERKASSAVPAIPMPTPQKSQPAQANWSSTSSRSISASSPSKAASPIQINSHASHQSKYKGDDDLFWGPIEQSKQETKQSDFPQLASQGSWGSKNVPLKGNSPGFLTRQKSASGKPTERPLQSPPASSPSALKLKKDAMTKHSEAMGFRDWCENECVKLIGTKDTSFLEFCLKQSRSEAETLLIENLGSYDPDHQFIDKFLNYKELLPSDVLDIAFQSRHDKKVNGLGVAAGGMASAKAADIQDVDQTEGSSKGGGKKKGKKGKKVSPLVLGFNVVSNRIMMGEIQTVED